LTVEFTRTPRFPAGENSAENSSTAYFILI